MSKETTLKCDKCHKEIKDNELYYQINIRALTHHHIANNKVYYNLVSDGIYNWIQDDMKDICSNCISNYKV